MGLFSKSTGGKVELGLTGTGDRHRDAQAFAAEVAKDGGTLRRQP